MKHVGIREFKDKATSLIASNETLVIERHGEPVGVYMPLVAKDRKSKLKLLDKLDKTVEGILQRTGMTEDELVEALTWKKK